MWRDYMEDKDIQETDKQSRKYEKRVVVDIGAGAFPFPVGLRQRKVGENEFYIAVEPVREKVTRACYSLKNFPIGEGFGGAVQARGEKLPLKDRTASEGVNANF